MALNLLFCIGQHLTMFQAMYLKGTCIKLKLSKAYQRNAEKKYDVGRLADPKRKTEYSIKLRKSLQKLEHQEESDKQRRWSEIREGYSKTAEKVLGFVKHQKEKMDIL
ncbi:hypothetical protein BpHYR1_034107 [Brachionus plicatilis]|uniref:Uncharacterized protein n=1 Tax=Brachionus plicatilis TaxID=10195 RepID=A0A3M7PL56_BRAPC|nr:hypothetical protein BpHYR1_034107 [Brachionus plicatilis]